jgi:hypothetical protein
MSNKKHSYPEISPQKAFKMLTGRTNIFLKTLKKIKCFFSVLFITGHTGTSVEE